MPRGDGTGPAGLGPMTGRAAGYCAGYSVPGFMNPIPGRGWWRETYPYYRIPYGYSYPPVAPYSVWFGRGRGWFGRGRGWFGRGRWW